MEEQLGSEPERVKALGLLAPQHDPLGVVATHARETPGFEEIPYVSASLEGAIALGIGDVARRRGDYVYGRYGKNAVARKRISEDDRALRDVLPERPDQPAGERPLVVARQR